MPTVEFYVFTDSLPDAHLRHACRLAEQAVDQGSKVFVRASATDDAKRIDDLLWTFGDRSFLPHEFVSADAPSHPKIRVLIGSSPPADFRDFVINLSDDALTEQQGILRIAEFVPGDAVRKAAARERFKYYRSLGIEPLTHNV